MDYRIFSTAVHAVCRKIRPPKARSAPTESEPPHEVAEGFTRASYGSGGSKAAGRGKHHILASPASHNPRSLPNADPLSCRTRNSCAKKAW